MDLFYDLNRSSITSLNKFYLGFLTFYLNLKYFRGLTGFLPADEASPRSNKDLIDSKDEFMELKETNQYKERKVPTKKASELKRKIRPTCKKCMRKNLSLMEFFHHSPVSLF